MCNLLSKSDCVMEITTVNTVMMNHNRLRSIRSTSEKCLVCVLQVSSALGKTNMSLCHVKGVLELVRTVDPHTAPGNSLGGSRVVNRYSPARIWPAAVYDRLKLYGTHCTGPLPADLILVFHSGTDARSAMRRARARSTWLQSIRKLEFRVLVMFTVALSNNKTVNDQVRREAETSEDMLIFDFTDSFRNLTLKTMSTFEWIAQNCSNARFILKTDEDTFVNFTNILHFLPSVSRSLGVLGSGYGFYDSIVFRDLNFKFGVPVEQYPFKFFGPYCSGRGYLMSAATLQLIVRASAFVPVIDMEDVYVGKCNQCLGMRTLSIHYFACQYKKNDRNLSRCVVIHDMNWQDLNSTVT